MSSQASVVAVCANPRHTFSKPALDRIELIAGHGVLGDAHFGTTVKHRSRVAVDPSQPNLRQVHLIHAELLDELGTIYPDIAPGALGENITTAGLDLLGLPTDTLLQIGDAVVLRVTGLRNPCKQIEAFGKGLLAAVLDRDAHGALIRKSGVMAVVEEGGVVLPGSFIAVQLPEGPHRSLQPV
ncbi:MOSC domain-containing protein [Devosia pacifica]|uniref:MOSC domain-containing protein n=1 Tax=Devosia pacifica TaxID=1335967 RepID=UPI00167B7C49|nr:MOSC domain-containing protein [Devosia pacifica]